VHVPINHVEVLDDSGFVGGSDGLVDGPNPRLRSVQWVQHATWGAAADKREEVRSTAVLAANRSSAYVENVRVRRLDPHFVTLHWGHRFMLEAVAPSEGSSPVTRLSETESLQSHRLIILMEHTGFRPHELRKNTKNFHEILFINIKAALERR
jgi:hypothetical protein